MWLSMLSEEGGGFAFEVLNVVPVVFLQIGSYIFAGDGMVLNVLS
jgi:hypothetical protein